MKTILILLLSLLIPLSTYAQTEEELKTYLTNGFNSFDQGDHQEAIRQFEAFRDGYRKLHGEKDEIYGTVLQKLAISHSILGDYEKALDLWIIIVDYYKSVYGEGHPNYIGLFNDFSTCLRKYHDSANVFSSKGEYAKALAIGNNVLKICESTLGKNHRDYAMALHCLAGYYSESGDYSKALELENSAVVVFKSALGDKSLEYASSIKSLSNYYYYFGEYTKAVEMCERAKDIFRSIHGGRTTYYAAALSDLAKYYSHLGDKNRAIDLCSQALVLFKTEYGDNHYSYAATLCNLARYYSLIGNYTKAIELATRSIEIMKSLKGEEHHDYATTLSTLSIIYASKGDYAEAIELGKKVLKIYRTEYGEKHPNYATALTNLACYYSNLGDYSKALEFGGKGAEILKSTYGDKSPEYAASLKNIAVTFFKLGNEDKAYLYFRDYICILQAIILNQFAGLTSKSRSDYWAQYSFQFTDIFPFFTYHSNITTSPLDLFYANQDQIVFKLQSHTTAASDLYDKSALFAKGLLLSTEIEINRLIQESDDEETLKMFEELQRNRIQLQKLYESPIAKRHINTDSLALIVDRQEKDLIKRSQVFGDFTRKLQTTWIDIQGALKENEIAIEFLSFYVGEKQTMIAALTLRKDDKEPKFTPLFEQRQLQSVSDTIYYHSPELTDLVWKPLQQELQGVKRIYFSPAGALHNIGIEYAPGMEGYEMYRLSTTREVIDMKERGEMLEIATTSAPSFPKEGSEVTPMAALFGGIDYNASLDGSPPSLGGGQGEASVSIALHRAFIDSLDIRGAKVRIQELPGTKTEVEEIKRSFDNKHRSSILHMGADATETSVKVLSGTKPNILHIATHGFYFTEKQAERQKDFQFFTIAGSPSLGGEQGEASPEDKALTRSGLLMAGANVLKDKDLPMEADDGILTAQEISRLDLRGLDLVVLSACQTGKGDINQGEGVFGLQRGFKKAGAQTLVMSLWNVDDNATQIIMTAFYDNLLKGQSKRDAFHNAQQHLRTVDNGRYNEPQYWAAFILLD